MKKNYSKYITLILVCLAFTNAQDKAGTAAATELLIPTSAHGLAISGSYAAGITGLDALSYNPAGINYLDSDIEAMFSYMNYIADINFSYAAVGFKFSGFGSIAVSIRNLDFGDIPITTVEKPYGTGDFFSPTFVTAGITYANSLSDNLSIGLTANIITEKILQTSGNTVGFDIGFQIRKMFGLSGLKFGGALKNLGPPIQYDGSDLLSKTENAGTGGVDFVKFDTPEFDLPFEVAVGLAFDKMITEEYRISLSSTFVNSEYINNEYRFGGEFSYDDLVFIRGGYTYIQEADDDPDLNIYGPTFGAGFKISGAFNIVVDYGFRQARYFSNNHMMSVRLGF